MSDLQKLFDEMGEHFQQERSQTQMTLGDLIFALKTIGPGVDVPNICKPDSYRGYYSDIAFVQREGTRKSEDLLNECKGLDGAVLTGYKGGDFDMDQNTPLWIAPYGHTGEQLMAFGTNGIETKEEEW